jgi:hypothetical protein
MTTDALIDTPVPTSHSADALDAEILKQINEQVVVGLDVLISLMPQYSWNQIFHTVDRLARCRKIVLRRHGFDYTIVSSHYVA